MGKPIRRFQVYDHSRGLGKIHEYIYSYENKVWYVACRSPYKDYQGDVIDDPNVEVTCKRCLAGYRAGR